jgi:molybdenum cofactor cytidylyltransferase
MTASVKITAVLLAAGLGTRFGGNKLEALLAGQMLGLHAARTLADLGSARLLAVCNPDSAALIGELEALGFTILRNHQPEAGLSRSLRLAVEEARDADALLIALADMPFVTGTHLATVVDAYDGSRAVASSSGAQLMPPALFPRALFAALQTADGDAGARDLLRAGLAVPGDPAMLADIDTRADIERLIRGA